MLSSLTPNHSIVSGCRRLAYLLREIGLMHTLGVAVSLVEDRLLRIYDHWYGVKTSGLIRLEKTSFTPNRLADATALYGPVNAWAFRKMLAVLALPRSLRFVDLGSGLGRACFLAAEYGFQRVIGVELASDLCAAAKENLRTCKLPATCLDRITILEMDALRYCETTDDDVFFLFRPFSLDFMQEILRLLTARAAQLGKKMTLIYTERIAPGNSYLGIFEDTSVYRAIGEVTKLGQVIVAYEIGAPSDRRESSALT